MDKSNSFVVVEASSDVWLEQRFWLQVLGDHARFIHDSLAPQEKDEIKRAHRFIRIFDSLLQEAQVEDEARLEPLNQTAYWRASELRDFKLYLLRRMLTGAIRFHLSSTFVNHMINELEEYMRILKHIQAHGRPPTYDAIQLHLIWLQDAVEHADSVSASLARVEKRLTEKSGRFSAHFTDFYMKAVEMAGYLRTQLQHFPALNRFNREVELEMMLFKEFLEELESMDLDAELLGTLQPLMADHMAREECYYMMKLSLVGKSR
ncbi:DUF2935 domain-containing protein [Paenibacillus senegalensis]|uniref:DUF2935 domain-containing protein n=1 Tax=Paenibacillus senegalensis TaxID=1465766 RepID=UPI0005A9D4CD|nr:DUF2935 domain-containing protein [Paenibacillus senegalensis]